MQIYNVHNINFISLVNYFICQSFANRFDQNEIFIKRYEKK